MIPMQVPGQRCSRVFILLLFLVAALTQAFQTTPSSAWRLPSQKPQQATILPAQQRTASTSLSVMGRSSSRYGKSRSKRQERVGHLVRTELSHILHTGIIKGGDASDYLESSIRKGISVVSADVAPDLRQARISVSIRPTGSSSSSNGEFDGESSNPAVDKRRAYAWLVRNAKPIRHTLAQKMSHMKSCPSLTFVQVDVSAAVDVMYLIDKVSAGYKRNDVSGLDNDGVPRGVVDGIDFDEDLDDEDDWDEEDDNFFE